MNQGSNTSVLCAATLAIFYLMCIASDQVQGLDQREPFLQVRARSMDGGRGGPGRATRFYQGTRYGGKRSYWQPFLSAESESPTGFESMERTNLSPPSAAAACHYLALIGMKCPDRLSESTNLRHSQLGAGSGPGQAGGTGAASEPKARFGPASTRLWSQPEVVLDSR